MRITRAYLILPLIAAVSALSAERPHISGIYPHLAMFNDEGECGTGAVVPWADRLWVITYGPHLPNGSSDKLYEITPSLEQIVRSESIGGTPANRLIHSESQQLIIGPYFIDPRRRVRVVHHTVMPGRLTGTARHLTHPAEKVYFATMEEGLYEVDVKTLAVKGLIRDGNFKQPLPGETAPASIASGLPGYHGKGLYSGQGRLVYANNGERDKRVTTDPTIPSGALAEWQGQGDWRMLRRNQFTEVTGPGGIRGNEHPETDPLWSVGWDHRSLILMILDSGQWHAYRLPKASHTYDGSHGWNTEWPRIRDIGEGDFLMTMHGTFWRFPRDFAARRSAGIAPRSTYLKVIGDFCRWQDGLVFGCDDTAKAEFLNKRRAKGKLAGPGQSQSNLWFVQPERLDQLGAPLGRGAVWLDEAVKAGQPSDPFLFAGYQRRMLHLACNHDLIVTVEVDAKGDGQWAELRRVEVRGYGWIEFPTEQSGAWVRLRADRDCGRVTAQFHYSDPPRVASAPESGSPTTPGLLRARGDNLRTLAFATSAGYYEMGADLVLKPVDDAKAEAYLRANAAIPEGVLSRDSASIIYVDDAGKRWRLPTGGAMPGIPARVDREVTTERDLFNAGGTFFELPAENAGGFAKVRPIATHNQPIYDYCSYRGLLIMSGALAAPGHEVRSVDGKVSLWAGAVDDLWALGKPVGEGGPWKETSVKAGVPSDPYLMTGYDNKHLTLRTGSATALTVEVDLTGGGLWSVYRRFDLTNDQKVEHQFPDAFGAYWLRVVSERDCVATAWLDYR